MEEKIFLEKYRVMLDQAASPALFPDAPRTYQGESLHSKRKVTVEVFPTAALSPGARERLEEEARAAMKLGHVNIPLLYDFGIRDDQLIYVSEFLDGTSAEEWVNANGPMPADAVLGIALQVVSAVGAAAIPGIIHREINPSNLAILPGQTTEGDWPLIKVLHFAGVESKPSTTDVTVAAFDKSAAYASPEQLEQGTVDFRSEIYALGATMWFLLTGAPPLVSPKVPVSAVDKLSGVPKRVQCLLTQMLSLDPQARPGDPLAFYRQLQDCLAQVKRRETMARKLGVPMRVSARSRVAAPAMPRFSTKALALAALLLALATIAAVALPGYLKHHRIRNAEQPIGVPIGVPEPSAAPLAAAINETPKEEEIAPAVDSSATVASTIPAVEDTTTEQPQVAEREVRRALPYEPEVRRAEPDVPAEEPVVATEVKVAPPTNSEPAAAVTAKAPAKKTKSATGKRVRVARNADEMDERPLPPLRRGSVRVHFVGVTADGSWMLALPSREVIVVPPPPGN